MNILIVDDYPELADALKLLLEGNGRLIKTINCPERALKLINCGEKFDVVLSDFEMPKMNGLELCRKISEKSNTRCAIISGVIADKQREIEKSNFTFFKKSQLEFESLAQFVESIERSLSELTRSA
tara:strand:+ start:6119 stop:6496 length:378 start_codon:yes stop_codon:yes gene_type:complete